MKKVYLIAVICALIAGFATFLFATEISQKSSYVDAQKVPVVTAITQVPQNTTITAENFSQFFEVREVVASYALEGAISNSNDALDAITRQTLFAGEQLTTNKLITAESDDATLSLVLPDGYVAYPIVAGGTNAADGYISVGDKVDVYVYIGNTVSIPLSDLEVLKVSNYAANATAETDGSKIMDYSTLTLIVTEEQAQELMQIEKGANTYKLVLKPRVSSGGSVLDSDVVKNKSK